MFLRRSFRNNDIQFTFSVCLFVNDWLLLIEGVTLMVSDQENDQHPGGGPVTKIGGESLFLCKFLYHSKISSNFCCLGTQLSWTKRFAVCLVGDRGCPKGDSLRRRIRRLHLHAYVTWYFPNALPKRKRSSAHPSICRNSFGVLNGWIFCDSSANRRCSDGEESFSRKGLR